MCPPNPSQNPRLLDAYRGGRTVKADGLGTFTPAIRTNGEMDIIFRPTPRLLRDLNDFNKLHARLLTKTSIGQLADDLAARWKTEHPDDPVEQQSSKGMHQLRSRP